VLTHYSHGMLLLQSNCVHLAAHQLCAAVTSSLQAAAAAVAATAATVCDVLFTALTQQLAQLAVVAVAACVRVHCSMLGAAAAAAVESPQQQPAVAAM
jgi:uncharacterized protein YabE (DUF348 family)